MNVLVSFKPLCAIAQLQIHLIHGHVLRAGDDDVLLSRDEVASAVCRRDEGIIVAHAHRDLRGCIPISQNFLHVSLSISISQGPVSGQQFSGQRVA